LYFLDLENSDSGIYTCIASSESGETSWSALLTVESPRNPNIMFHRMPDPSTFPGPPQKPTIVNMTETSVTISWRRIGRSGSSPLIGSTIEYYSPDLQMGWTVAAKRIMTDIYTINNLQPDMRYIFFVRSENSHGLGPPSPVSDEVRTLGSPSSQVIPDYDLDEARIRLSSKSTELKAVTAVSSTAVKLFWDLQGGHEFVEGFYVRYRDMSNGGTAQKYNMVTLLYNEHPSNHLLPDLRKFTKYEFFLVPFYKNVEGKPSNTRTAQTFEDVPSAPPENLSVKIVNLTSATIEWSPPAPQHRNGNLLGYNIHIQGNISTLHSNITLNATITSITLHNLTTGAVYSVRVLAFTTVGPGPFSSPIALRMDPNMLYSKHADTQPLDTTYLSGVVNQTWFYIVIIIILIAIVSFIAVVVIMKRRIAWKKAISAHLTVPLHKSEEVGRGGFNGNAREALWINHGWRQSDKDNNATKLMNRNQNDVNNGYSSAFVADYCSVGNAPDYAEVDTHNLSTFYKKETSYPSSVPAPYATTTLINAVSQSKHGSVREHKSSGSEEMGSRKSEKPMPFDFNDDGAMDHLLAEQQAKSPSDSGSYTTDEYGMPVRKIKHHNKHRQQNNSFRPNQIIMNGGSSVSGNQSSKAPIVNWTDLIPPPPENPPSECGTPPDTPILNCSVRGHNPNRLIRVQVLLILFLHKSLKINLF
jgi:roundabout axon guidance receptor 2